MLEIAIIMFRKLLFIFFVAGYRCSKEQGRIRNIMPLMRFVRVTAFITVVMFFRP